MVRRCDMREWLNATPPQLLMIKAAAADNGPILEGERTLGRDSVSLQVPLAVGLVCSHLRLAVDEMPQSRQSLVAASARQCEYDAASGS